MSLKIIYIQNIYWKILELEFGAALWGDCGLYL
jgi:hypothetical protein